MLGTTLRDLRVALGFTIAELANLLGVDADTVRAWENGELRPDREQTTYIFDVLSVLRAEMRRI